MNKNNRKAHLFQTAFKLFLIKGYEGVSISDIEKESGMTRGAITYYGEDKLGLFYNVVKEYLIQLQSLDTKLGQRDFNSMKDFIESYVAGAQRTMDYLHSFDPTVKNGSRCYISLALQICDYFPDLHEAYLRNLNQELLTWIDVIQKAREKGEIRGNIDVINMAKIFMDVFSGRSFFDALTTGLNTVELKMQLLTLYDTLKK